MWVSEKPIDDGNIIINAKTEKWNKIGSFEMPAIAIPYIIAPYPQSILQNCSLKMGGAGVTFLKIPQNEDKASQGK